MLVVSKYARRNPFRAFMLDAFGSTRVATIIYCTCSTTLRCVHLLECAWTFARRNHTRAIRYSCSVHRSTHETTIIGLAHLRSRATTLEIGYTFSVHRSKHGVHRVARGATTWVYMYTAHEYRTFMRLGTKQSLLAHRRTHGAKTVVHYWILRNKRF